MALRKRGKDRMADAANNGRRAFIWRMGAGVSTALAAVAGTAGADTGRPDSASLRAALLEEEKVLRKLHQAFELAMDRGRYEEVIGLFADNAEVVFNCGVFNGRTGGVIRLFRHHFPSVKTGRRMEPAPGFELTDGQQQDRVEVAQDRRTATAVFPYSIQVGRAIESDTSLAGMARVHGEGVQTWWEGGNYKVTYAKAVADDRWRIRRLEYITLSRADYRPGRSYARPIVVAPFAVRYPENRHGPDVLVQAGNA